METNLTLGKCVRIVKSENSLRLISKCTTNLKREKLKYDSVKVDSEKAIPYIFKEEEDIVESTDSDVKKTSVYFSRLNKSRGSISSIGSSTSLNFDPVVGIIKSEKNSFFKRLKNSLTKNKIM